MISREKAFEILNSHIKNQNLIYHGLAAEAAMKGLAKHFGESEEKWGLVGLLHDGDWEETTNDPSTHTKKMIGWLKEAGETDQDILNAILSHNFAHTGESPPKNKIEWAIYTCDELTGFIVAVTLITPDKKLSSVNVGSVLKKFPSKSFAAGVRREQIRMCENNLGLPLEEFIKIVLTSMQQISNNLGL
ncbi:MAG: phosphohydrolase [bacterium]